MKSIKNGNYYDPSIWEGGRVPSDSDDVEIATEVYTDNMYVVRRGGKFTMRKGFLQFRNINEATFVGALEKNADGTLPPNYPTDPDGFQPRDIGLWIIGNAVADIQGSTYRKRWTNPGGPILAGATQVTLNDITGWAVGDPIAFTTTRKPNHTLDWDDAANKPIDPFNQEFERKRIIAISGKTITIDSPIKFSKLTYTNTDKNIPGGSRTLYPSVANLNSDCRIEGTPGGRAHIYIKNKSKSIVKNLAGRYLGPRMPGRRGGPWLGRYALHFHHAGEAARGTEIFDNIFYDLGNRGVVVHGTHGVTVKGTVVGFFMEAAYWYDPQHSSHELTYDGCLAFCVIYNGGSAGVTAGFQFGQGDGNVARNNKTVYCKYGADPHTHADYVWNADDEGIWVFENNECCSSQTGIFIWQNSPHMHTVVDFYIWNCELSGMEGAYINSYYFLRVFCYNALWRQKATPGNNAGMFKDCGFNGADQIPYVLDVFSSPVPAGVPNAFINCTFKGYTGPFAARMNTFFHGEGENGKKGVDFIHCSFTKDVMFFENGSIYESFFRVQPLNGQPYISTQRGTTNIGRFASLNYGTGRGINAEYYNGPNFDSLAFKRIDSMIKNQQWSYDKGASPWGVHHLILGDQFSVKWRGYLQAQYTEDTQIVMESWGGVRVRVDGKLILENWKEDSDGKFQFSSKVPMVANQKYLLEIEHFNLAGGRGILANWYAPSMGEIKIIPEYQLYPTTTVEPTTFYSVEKSQVFTRNNCPVNTTPGTVRYLVGAGKYTSTISQPDADAKAQAEIDANGQKQANESGTCSVSAVFKNIKAERIFTRNNCAAGSTGSQYTAIVPAGTYQSTISQADADSKAQAWLNENGQKEANIKGTCSTTPTGPLMANAGPDQRVPGPTAFLDGSASVGDYAFVNWLRDSGPGPWDPSDQNNIKTQVKALAEGTHIIKLKLTGKDGKISEDRMTLVVGIDVPVEPVPKTINKLLIGYTDNTTTEIVKPITKVIVSFPDGTNTEYK